MRDRRRFDKPGTLLMKADLWGMLFGVDEPGDAFELRGDVAIVTVDGPLTQHGDWWCDSYDAIKDRISAALASAASTVLLKISSPGGEVAGCFETVREIRARAASAGKRVVAYADGMAASAGYALACAGDYIAMPDTAIVGSIGCITALMDWVGMNAQMGLNVAIIASGRKKRFGHPDVPISDAAIAERQGEVDALAELFFELVAEARPVTADALRALEAGCLLGKDAVATKLADRVCTFDELIAELGGGVITAPAGASEASMGWKDEMKKAAEEGDEEAKKCLDAMGEDDPPKSSEKGAEEPKDEKKAEDEPPEEKAEEPEKDEKAAAALATFAKGGGKVVSMAERVARLEEKDERAALLAARPDLTRDPKLAAKLASAPLPTVRWMTANLPRVAQPPAKPGAPTIATPPAAHLNAALPNVQRGAGEGAAGAGLGPSRRSERADELDERFGFQKAKPHVVFENGGTKMGIRLMTPTQARAHLKTLDARKAGQKEGV